jgi:hypothetical protein
MIMNFRSSINILSLYELVREHWLNMQLKCSTGVGISSAAFSDILSKRLNFLGLRLVRLYYHNSRDSN